MKISNLIVTIVIGAAVGVMASTEQAGNIQATRSEVLKQARDASYQAREGHFDAVPRTVTLLKEAAAVDPTNAALWSALGGAFMLQASAAGQPGGNFADALTAFDQAAQAFERTLQLDPNDAFALANHGMTQTIRAGVHQKPEWAASGVVEMNRAVETNPRMIPVRLVRAFTSVNLPPPLRNTQTIVEDLEFLIQVAEGSRAGDTLHLLLGDVYAENGKANEAQRQYEAADRPASTAHELARARLSALAGGSVAAADMGRLRSGLGTNCVMCHAK